MQRALIVAGIAILVIGLLWPWLSKLPLGRLPGDILVEREGFRFHTRRTWVLRKVCRLQEGDQRFGHGTLTGHIETIA